MPRSRADINIAVAASIVEPPTVRLQGSGVLVVRECAAAHIFLLQCWIGAEAHRNPPVFPAPLDALVAVLVERRKILPKLLVQGRHRVSFPHGCKLVGEISKSFSVEFVLVGLQVHRSVRGLPQVWVVPVQPSGFPAE